MRSPLAALCGGLVLAAAGVAGADTIRGDYVEARTADVYTGTCFSNSEILITGDHAVAVWKVRKGSWGGVDLSGLGVAAAIKGTKTFSQDRPEEARSVILVDKNASPAQRDALVAMARALAGDRLSRVVAIRPTVLSLTVEDMDHPAAGHSIHHVPHTPRAAFWAPGLAEIVTRPLQEEDVQCGNETVAYEPLSRGVEVAPAFTLDHSFRGEGLNNRWDDPNCRSSFVGTFRVDDEATASR